VAFSVTHREQHSRDVGCSLGDRLLAEIPIGSVEHLVDQDIEFALGRETGSNGDRAPRVIGRVTRGVYLFSVDNHFGLPIDRENHATYPGACNTLAWGHDGLVSPID
jgi:hypothetical protein